MPVPQRLTFVTLGAWSVRVLRAFYSSWGWTENDGSTDDYASFTAGSVRLALYPIERLREEAAPDSETVAPGCWNAVTFAVNVATRAEVDEITNHAVGVGATLVHDAIERDWGGYSAYVADPEGNRWELAWAPGFEPS